MENDGVKPREGEKDHVLFFYLLVALLFCVFMRMLLVNSFTIVTPSMVPTIQPGDKVNAFRLLLFTRKIKANDIIVFYKPTDFTKDEVYCKRVLGTPGDRIGAVDGHCWNDRVLKPVGVVEEQEKLRWMFDGFFEFSDSYEVIPYTDTGWNIKNWGPLIVPAKGLTMSLDDFTRELYRKVIEYETGGPLDESLKEYTFRGDYYFAVGDNAMSSFDSRYWGFIPEDFIIGIVGGKRFRNK